jgi:hypothetical protein
MASGRCCDGGFGCRDRRGRPRDDGAHTEGHKGNGGEHAQGVAEHTQEAACAAEGERAPDCEERARSKDGYECKRREGEGPNIRSGCHAELPKVMMAS